MTATTRGADFKADAIQDALVGYAFALRYEDLTPEVVHAARVRIVDTFGSLVGGFDGEPCRIARSLAQRLYSSGSSSVIGTFTMTPPDMAAFVNATTARYVEMNDVYHWPKAGGGHPSDVIMPVLAVAEESHSTGEEFITAVTLAYEIYLCMAHSVRTPGFDFINNLTLATAIAAGKLLHLNSDELAECISMAIVPNNALGQARTGHLSHWKATASGQAGRAGVFAAYLAREGMQGAVQPFEGRAGWTNVVAGGSLTLAPMATRGGHFKILDTIIKPRSACATTLSSILATEQAAKSSLDVSQVEGVLVEVYDRAVHLGEGEHSYRPRTRESADHSIPFVVASALMDGTVNPETFREERLTDPQLLSLADKVKVVGNPEFTAAYQKLPLEHRTRVTVKTKTGEVRVGEVNTLKGGLIDPMSDFEIEGKFRSLTSKYWSEARAGEVLALLWAVDACKDIAELPPRLRLSEADENRGTGGE
jgi:2-methylcitrate dehydratase